MNIAYLIKCLDATKLSDLVAVIEMPPLDMNLILWDAVAAGQIDIDREKDRVKVLADDVATWHNPELTNKIIRTVQHYARDGETNPTRGRMNSLIKDPITNLGYTNHEYIMSMQYLVDEGQLVEDTVNVPKSGKRPFQKFIFIGLPENADQNQEWNARVVNKWIDDFAKDIENK